MIEAIETPCHILNSPVRHLQVIYPEEMREWVKYESPDDLSDEQVLSQVKERFEAPFPTPRTILEWRRVARIERNESRARVWERSFAESSRYLVPKVIVSLDKALTSMVALLAESRGEVEGKAADPKIAVQAAGKIREIGGELLTHLGAPTLPDTPVDPAQVRLQMARLIAERDGIDAETAAKLVPLYAAAVAALDAPQGAGQGVESVTNDGGE